MVLDRARCRPRAPGIPESVRADGMAPRTAFARQPAAARRRASSRHGARTSSRRGPGMRRRRDVRDRSRALHRTRPIAARPACAGRRRVAVGNGRRGARSRSSRYACAFASSPGRSASRGVHDARRRQPRRGAQRSPTATATCRAADRALSLSWTAAQVELRDPRRPAGRRGAVSGARGRAHLSERGAARVGEARAPETARAARALGAGHLGRLAHRARDDSDAAGLPSVRQLLVAHKYWRMKGVTADLVILIDKAPSYAQELHDQIVVDRARRARAASSTGPAACSFAGPTRCPRRTWRCCTPLLA